jgi:hypothetical protein
VVVRQRNKFDSFVKILCTQGTLVRALASIRKLLYSTLPKMKKLTWRQLNKENIPNASGIYAWYYEHKIGHHDVETLIESISNSSSSTDKRKHVVDFIERRVFSFYKETPYEATIFGQLKPRYQGQLVHQQCVSQGLSKKVADNPSILRGLRSLIAEVSYHFTSPLYIGMAKNLAVRLMRHKTLIESYRSEGQVSIKEHRDEETLRDHNFASRIVEKRFLETNLYVLTEEVDDKYSLHVLIENILNRMNYPILGRN